ncbi:MAG: endonuclease III [Candidatus Magasanikbacteria bacterium]
MQSKPKKKKRAQIVVKKLKELFPEDPSTALNYDNTWQLLVAVILSARTTDKKVNEVTEQLFDKYPTREDYLDLEKDELAGEIDSIGLYNSKAGYILDTAEKIGQDFDGEIPKNLEDMQELSGVGRKTANVVLSEAFSKSEGVAVDTHVQRLSQKFGLTDEEKPDKIEQDLMEILPQDEWKNFTLRMIEYGREYSPAHKVEDTDDPISQALKEEGLYSQD